VVRQPKKPDEPKPDDDEDDDRTSFEVTTPKGTRSRLSLRKGDAIMLWPLIWVISFLGMVLGIAALLRVLKEVGII